MDESMMRLEGDEGASETSPRMHKSQERRVENEESEMASEKSLSLAESLPYLSLIDAGIKTYVSTVALSLVQRVQTYLICFVLSLTPHQINSL
jgi:hypothetical protein